MSRGGKKDSEGKTEPRSLRHFPVKDANGNVDLAHVRNAIARAPQANVSDAIKSMVQAKARKLLNAKEHSELEAVMESPLDSFEEEIEDRFEDQNEPEPNDDNEGGEMDGNELEAQLRQLLNLGDDTNIVEHVKGMNDELEPVRNALKQNNERKAFAEAFPEEYALMQRLQAESVETNARKFAESYANRRVTRKEGDEDVATGFGLSALALEKIGDFAKMFSEGTATRESFGEVLDSIMNNGIVDYGVRGSSREEDTDDEEHREFDEKKAAAGNPQQVRKIFFEKVKEIQTKDELEFNAALEQAAKLYPTLAEAYRGNNPVLNANG